MTSCFNQRYGRFVPAILLLWIVASLCSFNIHLCFENTSASMLVDFNIIDVDGKHADSGSQHDNDMDIPAEKVITAKLLKMNFSLWLPMLLAFVFLFSPASFRPDSNQLSIYGSLQFRLPPLRAPPVSLF